MAFPLLLALSVAAGAPSALELRLPRRAPVAGGTLFAQVSRGAGAPFALEAVCFGRRYRVAPVALPSGTQALLLPLPLEAPPLGRLTVTVAEGEHHQSEVELDVAPRPTYPAERWLLTPDRLRAIAAEPDAEQAAIRAILAGAAASRRRWSGVFVPPATGAEMGRYGARRTIDGLAAAGEEGPLHRGIDRALRRGATVRAPNDALVLAVVPLPILGHTVWLDHGAGLVTLLAHLEDATVAAGEAVARGAAIGHAGDTGLSNGVMLHQELFLHGEPVDPIEWQDPPNWLREAPVEPKRPSPPASPPVAALTPTVAAATPPVAAATPALVAALTPPVAAATPALVAPLPVPAGLSAADLPGWLKTAIESRLPGATVTIDANGSARLLNLVVTIAGVAPGRFFNAVETSALVVGEITSTAAVRTNRLTIIDAASGQSVPLTTRDARQLWRERTGLATPVPRGGGH